MIDLSTDLYAYLKGRGFIRVKYTPFTWTRSRWWKIWHVPNGGDLLKVEPNMWCYFPVPGSDASISFGYTTSSLEEFLNAT